MNQDLLRKNSQKTPVYERMLRELQQAICDGTLPPRSPILSESAFCKHYGISRVSARTALAKLEKSGLIVKKNGIGSFVADLMDPAFSPRAHVCEIAVNLNDIEKVSWYYAKIYQAAAVAAPKYSAKLSIVDQISARTISPALYQGVLAIGADSYGELEKIARNGIEVVLFNRNYHHPQMAAVYVDYKAEAFRAVSRLLKEGHRNIAYIGPFGSSYTSMNRVGGYLEAFGRNTPKPEWYCYLPDNAPDEEYQMIITDYLTAHKPDAVFLPLGSIFLPFAAAVKSLKIRIPDDLEVISFDDVGDLRRFCDFPFRYIKMPLAQMTEESIAYLSNRISSPETVPVLSKLFSASLEKSS